MALPLNGVAKVNIQNPLVSPSFKCAHILGLLSMRALDLRRVSNHKMPLLR